MGIRVAVIDDERFFREGIVEVLEVAGIPCQAAGDGEQALSLAADPAVGVVLLDLGGDGLERLSRIRAQRPMLRVVALAGAKGQESVLEALRLGACDYLAKPLHDEELVLSVRRACESYEVLAAAEAVRARLVRAATVSEELSRSARSAAEDPAEELCKAAAELLQAGRTCLLRRCETGEAGGAETLRVAAAFGFLESLADLEPSSVGQGVAERVAASGEAVLVESRATDERFAEGGSTGRYASDSFVCVPLYGGGRSQPAGDDRAMAVLCAADPSGREAFGPEDLAILRLVSGSLGAGFFDATSTSAGVEGGKVEGGPAGTSTATETDRDAELMRRICDALANDVAPDRVLQAVLEPIEYELGARPVSLYLRDPASAGLVCEGQRDGGARADRKTLPGNRGLTGTAFQGGNLIATASPELDARYDPDVDTPEDGLPGPLLCVPIRLRGKVVGLCRVFLPAGEIASSRTGEALAAGLSAAVRNVLLYRSLVESIEEVAEARREARP